VAQELSRWFIELDLSPVERIPILGRTGPDITINELGLVIDVKSRLEVPLSCFANCVVECSGLISVPLGRLPELARSYALVVPRPARKIVADYYAHIKEWVDAEYPSGIAALVLHRPKMPYGKSMFVISSSDRKEFIHRWSIPSSQPTSLPSPLFSTTH
jgi:hypothetical protein